MEKDLKKVRLSWERFLNPAELRSNLIVASIYIAGFEILKESIISRIRDFFTYGFDKKTGWLVDEEYSKKVLNRNKSSLYASLSWLKETAVIDDNDLQAFEDIKKCRNELVHEMTKFITIGGKTNCTKQFKKMAELLNKIETWWIKEVEIPTNPEFDGKDIDENGIMPGPTIGLQLMVDIALGPEEQSNFYFNELLKRGANNNDHPKPDRQDHSVNNRQL